LVLLLGGAMTTAQPQPPRLQRPDRWPPGRQSRPARRQPHGHDFM